MKITDEEVLHIATLSRLKFTPKEKEEMKLHLSNMLEHFKMLDSVDTSNTLPSAHILDKVNCLREDEIEGSFPREELMQNAPETDGEAYILPKVLE